MPLNPGLSIGDLDEVAFTVAVCYSSPLADRVDDLGVGLFLALYVPLRPDAALLVKLQAEPITLRDKVLGAEGKLHHPGGDAPVDFLLVGGAISCRLYETERRDVHVSRDDRCAAARLLRKPQQTVDEAQSFLLVRAGAPLVLEVVL